MKEAYVTAAPAYAVGDAENMPAPAEGLVTATETVGDPLLLEAFETTSDLRGIGDPNVTPGLGEITAQSAQR